MAIRTNSEKKIEHSLFKLKIGTTNKIKPEVIYLDGKTFISPNEELDSYNKEICSIKRKFHETIQHNLSLSDNFASKYILNFKVAENGITPSKKSFLSFEFLFRQKDVKHLLKLNDAKKAANNMIENILGDVTDEIVKNNFNVSKTKS